MADEDRIKREYDVGAASADKLIAASRENDWTADVWAGFLDTLIERDPGRRPPDPACLDCVNTYADDHQNGIDCERCGRWMKGDWHPDFTVCQKCRERGQA